MTADQPAAEPLPLPENLIELLASAIRKGAGPFDAGQEYAAAAHALDALSASVFPALAGDAREMIGIVMGQLRQARERSAALTEALTQAVACFDPPNENCPGVNGYAEKSDVAAWRVLLAVMSA